MADITYAKPTWANGTTPAANATNIQAISDAIDKITHLANRGGAILDADTVSTFGIGTRTPSTYTGSEMDSVLNTGNYYAINPVGVPGTSYSFRVEALTPSVSIQFITNYSILKSYMRSIVAGTPGTWIEIFNSLTDGNGGQPPAPKPKAFGTGSTQGEIYCLNFGPSTTWTNPGGTWMYFYLIQNSTGAKVSTASGVTTGNISTGAGEYISGFCWRVI